MANKFWDSNLLAAKFELIMLEVKQTYLLVQSTNGAEPDAMSRSARMNMPRSAGAHVASGAHRATSLHPALSGAKLAGRPREAYPAADAPRSEITFSAMPIKSSSSKAGTPPTNVLQCRPG